MEKAIHPEDKGNMNDIGGKVINAFIEVNEGIKVIKTLKAE
ncbi:MAG: hypothetical protein ACJASQ_003688 [Crocinitomicaceae bacterium]|jgi:hypothetical protein